MLTKRIDLVHFQITKNCNLRCYFCGQWGGRGFFSSANGVPMCYEDWLACAQQLTELQPLPKIILWGGEPLVCPFFERLSEALNKMGFTLQLITNGTLIAEHMSVINSCFEKIYVSIDGLSELHDSVRGKGTFERVTKNLELIPNEKIEIMTVATHGLQIEPFAEYFRSYHILLHTMISLEKEEIAEYKAWIKRVFGVEAVYIDSWYGSGYVPENSVIEALPENVTFMAHGDRAKNKYCLSPFHHIHISWKGEVMYCTDFYDFSAGNVKKEKIADIFGNERSECFRREIVNGGCTACEHCSWRNNSTFL